MKMSFIARKVDQYTLDGIFIKTFDRILDASIETGSTRSNITMVCRGTVYQTKGFRYTYHGSKLKEWVQSSTPLRNHSYINEKGPSYTENSFLKSDYFGYFGSIGYGSNKGLSSK